jgi:hypothetical protein
MGIDPTHGADLRRAAHQVVVDAQRHLAAMRSGERMNMSRVWLTTPSVEFSTGTTPKLQEPALDLAEDVADGAERLGLHRWPKCFSAAAWVKVPSGPRIADRQRLNSSARQADMISRNSRALLVVERPGILLLDAAQDLGLALGTIVMPTVRIARP